MRPQLGDRVALRFTTDARTNLEPGDQGTVRHIDSLGTVHIDWDNGSKLGIIPGVDEIDVITDNRQETA